VSKYISDMTGITNETLEDKYDLDTIFDALYLWCHEQEPNVANWHFYSYGDGDVDFIKHSLRNIKSANALIVASIMIATMKDYSKQVTKYFKGTTSLIKAFNYLEELEKQQKHNALEDAKMLADVFMKIDGKEPLDTNPFVVQKEGTVTSYNFPTGVFYCKSTGKNATERRFDNIHIAMEWLIEHKIGKNERDRVHRDKMATKIMKAIRKNTTYMEYKWRRVK
jgi:inhibitor of KinA sporulation pathway (predicted exonuclease)